MIFDKIIESSFTISLVVNAALFIPQIMRILKSKDAKEVSFITFFGFWLIQLATTLHGFLNRDYLLAFGTLASMVTCGTVIWLIILYRAKK
ncbi:MAG: Uncharacterized protein K0R48_29 [Gammaproteobacteria bacterium]|jgi:MtN3 and saliva related transmembrane protein|nr:Uncharacterized protein [Gammaproteobacteria bacterium]